MVEPKKFSHPHVITGQDPIKFNKDVELFCSYHEIQEKHYFVQMIPIQAAPSPIHGLKQMEVQMQSVFICYILFMATEAEIKKLTVQLSLSR